MLVLFTLLLSFSTTLWAAPGGYIVKEALHSWWLRPILLVLTLILLPLIIRYFYKLRKSQAMCREALRVMARHHDAFEMIRIQQRVKECFQRLHAAWDVDDVSKASDWMTNWYWQNQQTVAIDRWKKRGLKNVCRLQGNIRIRPIYFTVKDKNPDFEGSFLVVKIDGEIEDYLLEEKTQKIVEGQKGFVSYESLWTFELVKGQWVVSNIAPESALTDYVALKIELPGSIAAQTMKS